MPRLPIAALACLALAGGSVVAGCGDDKPSESTPAAAPPAAQAETAPAAQGGDTVDVGMQNIKFVPDRIAAKVGQKIVWTNNEAIPHNVTATEGADFKSDDLGQDETFEYTPTKAGVIDYVCTIHSGQTGQIRVTK